VLISANLSGFWLLDPALDKLAVGAGYEGIKNGRTWPKDQSDFT
jgi:hypothetical protein